MDPELLLFTDKQGNRKDLQDVIADGLEVDYRDRYPALLELLAKGEPKFRLYACAMLASWGVPEALRTIAVWARDPAHAPWSRDPVTVDRFSGADAAFELLMEAVDTASNAAASDAAVAELRTDAMRAMLENFERYHSGRLAPVVLSADKPLAAQLQNEIRDAVERGVVAAKAKQGFDLATQVASLLGILAGYDDERAARAAEALLADGHGTRAIHEVAYALRFGTGPATLAILERLAKSNQDARESLDKRRPS